MANKKEIAISVKDLHKTFKLPHDQHSGIKQGLINVFRRNRKKGYETQHVLRGLDFEIEKGDFFGIVGRNGSGKSTLLKTLAGIYSPDKGAVQVNGSLVPFIELGVGFNPELTGRENVFLNGALLGFSRDEMDAMYDNIVEFAELERFMDQKLKNYSSGMQVRLAFSIAIRADGDILLLDEVLAVGDEAFQRKCNNYFKTLKKNGKTVILVTHAMDSVRKYCNKAMMIRDGEMVVYGSPEDVANEYSVENLETDTNLNSSDEDDTRKESLVRGLQVKISPERKINQSSKLEIKISYEVPTKIPTKIRLSLQDIDRNVPIFAASSQLIRKNRVNASLFTQLDSINDANLKASVSIRNEDNDILHFLPDSMSPKLSFKRTDYPNPTRKNTWAILFSRGEWK